MPSLRSILLFIGAVVATLSLVSACETAPPVQEMSDARQAIAVAREAGAEAHAAAQLIAAEQFLESAERNLNDEHNADARRDALEAKELALDARRISDEESGK